MTDTRTMVLVLFEGHQLLDLAGPSDVFSTATLLGATPGYRMVTATPSGGSAASTSGIRVTPDTSCDALATGDDAIDTLMVVGGLGVRAAAEDPILRQQLRTIAERSRRITSVCSGALLLAASGLLDGHVATTHWAACDELAEAGPHVQVERDRIYVRDRDRWTSAGVTAGIDLALAMVEDDHGPDLAHQVAAWLVVFARRPGGQSQFSSQLLARPARHEALRELQRWIPEHVGEDLPVATLAARANMSERTFVRSWHRETGTTPAAYVESVRVEAARRLLESTDMTVDAVARAVGLHRAERLHRAVRRQLGTTPGSYRAHFSRTT